MFKAGSIIKVVVTNFVTYTYVEMLPGPNLNMIIGPNGTGKSTIVAAIILGLGGNPKTVGRGTKISEYVKHNCNEATIEIHLQGDSKNDVIVITRSFDLNDKSVWHLNGKKVSLKEMESAIKRFNIQVDNLCQFLPQDRVQDFAKMNKQQLLQQTQIAICRQDLIEKQMELIKIRDEHKDLEVSTEKNKQKLQELHDANLRIEGKVQNLKKKDKYLKQIEHVERKAAWIKYESIAAKIEELKDDRKKAKDIYAKHKESFKPIENALGNAKKAINNIQRSVAEKDQSIRQSETSVQGNLDKCGDLRRSINRILGDVSSKVREIEQREQEITLIKNEIANLNSSKIEVLEQQGDENSRKAKIKASNENLKSISSNINKLLTKKNELEIERTNKQYELRKYENDLQKMENVKQQRLEWLQKNDRDAYSAVQWLRANKHLFKGEIYEPMVLELNVLNPQHAIFIENIIPFRDRVAFTCVVKEDMNLLIKSLREQEKLSVNVLYSANDATRLHSYQPRIPIEELRQYGMFSYSHSLFTGPEPIMKYLCKTYHIHNIPIGNDRTNQQYENVPPQITNFFSDKYHFSSSYSRYTNQKSTRQVGIFSNGSLEITLDAERLENVRGQIFDVRNECQKCNEEINALDVQVSQFNEKQSQLRNDVRQLQSSFEYIKNLDSKIRVAQNKLQNVQKDNTTVEQVRKESDQEIKRSTQTLVDFQGKIKDSLKKYSSVLFESELDKTNLRITRKQVTLFENKSQDIKRLCQNAEATLTRIEDEFVKAKNEGKVALNAAKQLSNDCIPTDEGFLQFRELYNKLPNDLDELEGEKEHIIAKIDCLNTADIGELQEYETRLKQISNLQDLIENADSTFDNVNTEMQNLKLEWLQPLEVLVNEINKNFSAAFHHMGCAGEVSICTGENEQDFSEYGLSIKVKYRDSEPLQELNNVIQSGGERAVATAAYMLSLQELTPVPFRCVDEINQGMDAINERRIFEILVDATSQSNTSQYFFITPKLVPHLKFVATMKIHIVHNGPFVSDKINWNKAIVAAKRAVA